MGKKPKRAQASDLDPVDWVAIEPHYRAGIRSLKSIGLEFGVSAPAIHKHFGRRGVKRDLKARIHAEAEAMVNAQAVNASVNATRDVNHEHQIVDANATILASVQIAHRKDIARARRLATMLLAELEAVCEMPELFGMVHDALSDPDEPAINALRDMASLVSSLPARTRTIKDLAETLGKLIGMEREAFGLDTASGTDGRPMVVIKDYCGRGDVDSPMRESA